MYDKWINIRPFNFYSDRVNQLKVAMAVKFDSVMARVRELEFENARLGEAVKNLLK